jgi:crotonobetainyl-CoA:carnitine CoA-transferase CaiB-like acyl-CoA transferase
MSRAVSRPDLLEEKRFGTYFTSRELKAELRKIFDGIFAQRPTAEWCALQPEAASAGPPVVERRPTTGCCLTVATRREAGRARTGGR